jgi:hypothetical protein
VEALAAHPLPEDGGRWGDGGPGGPRLRRGHGGTDQQPVAALGDRLEEARRAGVVAALRRPAMARVITDSVMKRCGQTAPAMSSLDTTSPARRAR